MEHPNLRKIQKLLTNYFTYFKSDDILVISEDKSVLPFAYLIHDTHYPKNLLLSVAVDYSNSINAVEISLLANNITPILLSDSYYISSVTGKTYFGDEANDRWSLESIDLSSIHPLSDAQH